MDDAAAGAITPALTRHRYTAEADGNGDTPALASSTRNRRGPQYGRSRRISNTRAWTDAGICNGEDLGR